ncbi:hypothetical protein JDV02_010096 [Purpureocillium takamizusanense]|uniref:C2 NT-type domain-containing protein n=1 Tax=Purpureocillium takamizusanense TaxID=2060973 RepID=A0A9Q8QS13_9HYPO|nr:uncharacterized protein JDV02_010096 [Purpureocillium takamizusanense]UNI24342.1 hypothetical protein JDV02_010096 [Purpureocillium takamizusanense]
MASLIGKARKPKFELHLKIFDLNNVPLAVGSSYVKWHLTHSMHAEHRGRTSKCPIANHKVDFGFSKVISSVRISIDKNNNLTECPIELEVVQEFIGSEKTVLGNVRLNLSEYVEESEAYGRDIASLPRKRSNSVAISPTSAAPSEPLQARTADDGIVRRYLMQDSKVNCTLKVGILMIQMDGERNYIAPPLRTAPVFGGIAGFMGPEQAEDETGPLPSISKGRDLSEVQDLYRRTLAASWSRQPSELPADECIEDIFSGGNGWKTKRDHSAAPDSDIEDDLDGNHGTLRPSDFRRLAFQEHGRHNRNNSHHRRTQSASSDKSASTVTGRGSGSGSGGGGGGGGRKRGVRIAREDSREARDDDAGSMRSGSMGSLAPTLGSSSDGDRRGDTGMRRAREVGEFDLRDDLVAWKLPSVAT